MISEKGMKMKKYLSILIYMLFISHLYAELPPYVYENLQKKSPEVLMIKATKVTSPSNLFNLFNLFNHSREVTVEAKVLRVRTSKSGLKAGDIITIFYTTVTSRPSGWVGPSSLPILKESEIYDAFLTKSVEGNYYIPSARGQSFE